MSEIIKSLQDNEVTLDGNDFGITPDDFLGCPGEGFDAFLAHLLCCCTTGCSGCGGSADIEEEEIIL